MSLSDERLLALEEELTNLRERVAAFDSQHTQQLTALGDENKELRAFIKRIFQKALANWCSPTDNWQLEMQRWLAANR